MRQKLRAVFSRRTLGADLRAGVVLGVESVPDGLASGLLAGVNPLAGLYGYLFGMVGAAFFTSSAFMAVQATGAMSLVVADAGLETRPDPDRALYTLAILTGIIMIVAALIGAGRLVSFVPTAVMTGFVTAVGVNIVLGQLSNFTGYGAQGANRIAKTIDVLLHLPRWSLGAVIVGAITVLIIVLLAPTRVAGMGLVVAVVVGSAAAALLDIWMSTSVVVLDDLVEVPRGLPLPVLPSLDDVVFLIVPAFSLAFVGIVQGAGVSAGIPTVDGKPSDPSKDFLGQGIGNVAAGLFRGMPVGGSMSASALIVAAGARTRLALVVSGIVMAIVLFVASDLVAYVAMPALAALLIVVGVQTIKPSRVYSVLKTGPLQSTIMGVTFVLTLLIPLQFAVLVGVGLGIILFVVQQSNRVRVRRVDLLADGRMRESDPPRVVPGGAVLVLQPYGSLFFASAPTVQKQLPAATGDSRHAAVVVRLRGTDQIGLALIDVLRRYAAELVAVDASLRIVASEQRVLTQLRRSGLSGDLGPDRVYEGTEWIGKSLRVAVADAQDEIDARRGRPGGSD
ncbi:SulP family inorganic anion transporter [Microbacterium flavum]|uniref:SulP family inorganic anion transporter n=1 Tax=Microbacterium flavum TaxID=415216 RepID=A0ABS5XU75_9MICO|nr:SulP family inorganic anion transporter [Microbacterium flavum]MBT8798090.1 SulP family inorganic anion transporter [Microbacterium flavum]